MDSNSLTTSRSASSAEPDDALLEPLRMTIRVRATPERAFRVFAQQMDSWWPRSHHIGSSPMKSIVVEGHPGGAIYTLQEDGTRCPWASVVAWEPPHRFVFAWHVTPEWKYEADIAHCSEVEVHFSPADDGTTLVELEHRHFERHGQGWQTMRSAVGFAEGWNGMLTLFAAKAEEEE
jgi:Activator of Hsp90 ATPase homolog 1-like protein